MVLLWLRHRIYLRLRLSRFSKLQAKEAEGSPCVVEVQARRQPQGCMLAPMYLTPIGDFADVKPVLEEMGKRPHAKANTAALAAIAAAIDLGPDARPVELCNQSAHGDSR